jgi:photosystem II stability/assembly factor-like uncharacterized protein
MRALLAVASAVVLAACGSTSSLAVHGTSPSAVASPTNSKTALPTIPSEEILISMRMTSLSVMWAATETRILRSTDAGRSWTDVTPANRPGNWSAFFAVDDSAAWAVHSDYGTTSLTILRTTDGGLTWHRSAAPTPGGGATGVDFVDRSHGWIYVDLGVAAGSEGIAIVRTVDGGASWQVAAQTDDPTTNQGIGGLSFGCDKAPMAFGSPSIGLLPTECAGGRPYIYRTTDAGSHWTTVNLPNMGSIELQGYFLTPTFLSPTDAVTVGSYYAQANQPSRVLLTTHDGGATWSVNRLPGGGSVYFASTLSGWQVNDTLSATSDGGRTWGTIGSLPFKGIDMTLQYLGNGIGIAWGNRQATAFRTDDGGHTWHSVAPGGLHI